LATNIGLPFDVVKLNEECNLMLGHTASSDVSDEEPAAAVEPVLPQLRIRVPPAAAAAAVADSMLEPGNPPQSCCRSSSGF
jgi:hypothetical protein